jgi:glycosyltransferase involved in cell wall biosynthesis
MELSVVLPCYQAASFVGERVRVLDEFLATTELEYEIVAVDDGSTDGTTGVLEGLGLPRLTVLTLPANRGKYGALKAGMEVARGRCRMFTDADVPYELSAIPYMARLVLDRGFHVVIGDRTLRGASYRSELRLVRRVLTSLFTLCIRLFVTGGLWDTQCGLKALRGDVAERLFPLVHDEGFAGDVELLYVALTYNLEIKRVPVRLRYQAPSSVNSVRDGWRMLVALFGSRRGESRDEALERLAHQDYWSE